MTQEVLKSELDLFKNVTFQGSIESSQFIQYRPTSALTENSSIEFAIPLSADEYLDLQNIYLWIKGKVVQTDGADFPADQNGRYSLINYALNTIFDQLSIYLGGTLVSQSSKTYNYLAFIEAITQLSTNSGLTYLTAAGFNAPFKNNDFNFANVDTDLAENYKGSKHFTLYGKIHGSIFNSDKLLLNGVPLHLIFTRAPQNFAVHGMPARAAVGAVAALAEANPKYNLNEVSLFVRKVKLSPNLLNAHARALQISKAIYPIKRSIVKVVNLPANQSSFVLDNVIMGQMPCKIVFGFVSDTQFSGTNRTNPMMFSNHDLTFLCVHINGESFPKSPYQPDYRNDSKQYEREYFDFLMNIGATKSIAQPPIDYINYAKGFCLYAFNFNSDFENPNESDYINIPKEGFLNIEVKFRANLANALKLIFYAQFDNVIEIDENRNVTVDYSG